MPSVIFLKLEGSKVPSLPAWEYLPSSLPPNFKKITEGIDNGRYSHIGTGKTYDYSHSERITGGKLKDRYEHAGTMGTFDLSSEIQLTQGKDKDKILHLGTGKISNPKTQQGTGNTPTKPTSKENQNKINEKQEQQKENKIQNSKLPDTKKQEDLEKQTKEWEKKSPEEKDKWFKENIEKIIEYEEKTPNLNSKDQSSNNTNDQNNQDQCPFRVKICGTAQFAKDLNYWWKNYEELKSKEQKKHETKVQDTGKKKITESPRTNTESPETKLGEWGSIEKTAEKTTWHEQDLTFKKGETPRTNVPTGVDPNKLGLSPYVEQHPYAMREGGMRHTQGGIIEAWSPKDLLDDLYQSDPSKIENPLIRKFATDHGGFTEVEPGRFVTRDNLFQLRITAHEMLAPNPMTPLKDALDLAATQGVKLPRTNNTPWGHMHLEAQENGVLAESSVYELRTPSEGSPQVGTPIKVDRIMPNLWQVTYPKGQIQLINFDPVNNKWKTGTLEPPKSKPTLFRSDMEIIKQALIKAYESVPEGLRQYTPGITLTGKGSGAFKGEVQANDVDMTFSNAPNAEKVKELQDKIKNNKLPTMEEVEWLDQIEIASKKAQSIFKKTFNGVIEETTGITPEQKKVFLYDQWGEPVSGEGYSNPRAIDQLRTLEQQTTYTFTDTSRGIIMTEQTNTPIIGQWHGVESVAGAADQALKGFNDDGKSKWIQRAGQAAEHAGIKLSPEEQALVDKAFRNSIVEDTSASSMKEPIDPKAVKQFLERMKNLDTKINPTEIKPPIVTKPTAPGKLSLILEGVKSGAIEGAKGGVLGGILTTIFEGISEQKMPTVGQVCTNTAVSVGLGTVIGAAARSGIPLVAEVGQGLCSTAAATVGMLFMIRTNAGVGSEISPIISGFPVSIDKNTSIILKEEGSKEIKGFHISIRDQGEIWLGGKGNIEKMSDFQIEEFTAIFYGGDIREIIKSKDGSYVIYPRDEKPFLLDNDGNVVKNKGSNERYEDNPVKIQTLLLYLNLKQHLTVEQRGQILQLYRDGKYDDALEKLQKNLSWHETDSGALEKISETGVKERRWPSGILEEFHSNGDHKTIYPKGSPIISEQESNGVKTRENSNGVIEIIDADKNIVTLPGKYQNTYHANGNTDLYDIEHNVHTVFFNNGITQKIFGLTKTVVTYPDNTSETVEILDDGTKKITDRKGETRIIKP